MMEFGPRLIRAAIFMVVLTLMALVCLSSPLLVCSFFGSGFDDFPSPGHADFSTPLSGGYSVSRTSSHQISVTPDGGWNSTSDSWDSPNRPMIEAKVIELDHDDTFVIAKRQHMAPEGPVPNAFSYWILNVKIPQVWGPLSESEFRSKRTELQVDPALKLHDVYDYRP